MFPLLLLLVLSSASALDMDRNQLPAENVSSLNLDAADDVAKIKANVSISTIRRVLTSPLIRQKRSVNSPPCELDNNGKLQWEPIMTQYITDLDVSLNQDDERTLSLQGYTKIPVDLNKGAGGDYIYLWYKTGTCGPITRIQFSFTEGMKQGLITEGYQQVEKDLNKGAEGSYIYLWYKKGSTEYDVPIVQLAVSTNAEEDTNMAQPQWERSACDLNRGAGGDWIYLWMKRESQTYICDVQATNDPSSDANLFRQGYIRIDEDTNRGAGGSYVFLWYRQSTDENNAIRDLQVSTDQDSVNSFLNQHYEQVKINLNEGTSGTPVYLWYKKTDHIKLLTVILNMASKTTYENAGINVIKKDLNTNNDGMIEYVSFK